MQRTAYSRVAELLFDQPPEYNFARAVAELNAALSRICSDVPNLVWEYDDIAFFDMPGLRILLSQSESPYPGFASRLVVSVGPSPIASDTSRGTMVHAAICVRLVDRLKSRVDPAEVRWNDILGVVTAEDIDRLCEDMTTEQGKKHKIESQDVRPEKIGESRVSLDRLRSSMYPHGAKADFPAVLSKVATNSFELAASLAVLPSAAILYAAHWYRSMSE